MDLVIVGGGAIGRLFGYYLARAGHHVTVVDNDPEVVDSLNSAGIGFMGIGETNPDTYSVVPVRAERDGKKITQCNLVLLTVKSSATAAAAENIAHLVSPERPLLSLQTGLGNVELLQDIVGPRSVLAGFTFMSGATLGTGKIRHGGLGTTYIGELDGTLSDRLQRIGELLQECGIQTRQVKRILGRLWSKVIIYAAINPVSAILRVSNGNLIARPESITLMKRLIDEGCSVARACRIDLVYPDLWAELQTTCKQSIHSISPMLQDILNELPTEIDAQNGAICRFGAQCGVAAPTHETLVLLIKLLERGQAESGRLC